MTQAEATELLNQRLLTVFADAWPDVPYALNNETYRPPSTPFARFYVANVVREQRSMGAVGKRRFEYRALFVAQLFGELDRGTSQIDEVVDGVRAVFGSKHLASAGDPLWTKGDTTSTPIQREGLNMVSVAIPVSWFNLE